MKTEEIDKEITSRLPKDLNKMFIKKNINANVNEVSVDSNFVRMEMLVNMPNTIRTKH